MMRNRIVTAGIALVLAVFSAGTTKAFAQKLTFKTTTISVDTAVETEGLRIFKRLVEASAKKAGKDYDAQLFTGGVLSKGVHETETEMVQKGALQFQCASLPRLAVFEKRIGVFGLPILFATYEDQYRFYNNPLAEEIVKPLDNANLKVLSFWRRPWRQLSNSKRPIVNPADLKGLKFRAPNITMIVDTLNLLGAKPAVMAWGEVYTALQQGVIDGQDNGIDTTFAARLYEVQGYFTIWNYMVDPIAIVVDNSWWNRLDQADREIIQKALTEAEREYFQLLLKSDNDTLEKLKKLMKVTVLTPEQINVFRQAIRPIWDGAEKEFGKDFVERVRKVAQQ
jgi:tripartite ATP-independent transporter DctP family solute receptor